MFDNIFGKFGKRRRVDEGDGAERAQNASTAGAGAETSSLNNIWDHLFGTSEGGNTHAATATANATSASGSNNGSRFGWPSYVTNRSANSSNTRGSHNHGGNEHMSIDRPFNLNERFVTVLDQLDARVEKFRKDALGLQEKRDFLLMSMDLIKSNDLMQNLTESEREEITCYIQRVNSRLSTVELHVRTVRDQSQEDSLSQINALIDMMITLGDPVMSRQRCQMYLNACCTAGESVDMDDGPMDKKFESVLLGCTLDDQKNIKKRLQALMCYLNKQIIHH